MKGELRYYQNVNVPGWTQLQVTFWGVRGSMPTPGPETSRWGGNSSCIEVRHEGLPPLVLDCGTGARLLGEKLLREQTTDVHVLFTHFHLDHVFGFGFFAPVYTAGAHVSVTSISASEEKLRTRLGDYMNGTYHPLRLASLPSQVQFHAEKTGTVFERGGYSVRAHALNHPGGSYAYRIEVGGQSLCYVTDTAPFAQPGEGLLYGQPPTPGEARMVEFLRDADLVIYDTMFELSEYLEKITWGHSYPEYARGLCEAAGVRKLMLFHHSPDATDEDLDERKRAWAGVVAPLVGVAREGATVNVEG